MVTKVPIHTPANGCLATQMLSSASLIRPISSQMEILLQLLAVYVNRLKEDIERISMTWFHSNTKCEQNQ